MKAGSQALRKVPTSRYARSVKIAVTLGDAAGIGPEVTLKALAKLKNKIPADVLLLGPESFYETLAKKLKCPFRTPCYFPANFPKSVLRGVSQKPWTMAAARSIELGARLALEKKVDAIVTSPINKAGLQKAGLRMPGHTEFLAALSKTKRVEMMLVGGPLRVVLVTRHLAISNVPSAITRKKVEETILTADAELRRSFGIRRPRLVVCGLNPHAGESGNFGREEIEKIAPAVKSARKKTNAEITGPLSPDALFHDAYTGRYDAEICMYHDQGLIPLKMISRGAGVNVTLGLPFVRTSPDHGTAYDIADSFCADAGSMIEAIQLAVSLVQHRKRYDRSHPRG